MTSECKLFRKVKKFIRILFATFYLSSIIACGDSTQTENTTSFDTTVKVTETAKQQTSPITLNKYGFDTSYEISKEHTPFIVTAFFNPDDILDTAILIRNKLTDKDALFIKHGETEETFLIKKGKNIGTDFSDFNWVGQFEKIRKGTKIWDNVIDGEIVAEFQVPENKKITLLTDGIFVHVDEASGGGIIYYKNGKYVWLQQD